MAADFVHGVDKIDLTTIDAQVGGGDDAFLFAGPNTAVIAKSITWFENGGQTVVLLDNDGNTTADMTIYISAPVLA